jgi:transposase-like protein
MATHTEDTRIQDAMKLLSESGLGGIGEMLRVMLNAVMRMEREQYLGLGPYERKETRTDYANGFKPKTIQTRVGELEVAIPQVRSSGFYPNSLEKGVRSERALKVALAEMYVQGVSTRKVKKITEELCGFEVTTAQVSRAAAELDTALTEWRERPLGLIRYLIVDAVYLKIRHGGRVMDEAVLIATGIDALGKRQVLGISVSLSEAELHWRTFFQSLTERGLHGVELIVSDDHAGLKAARRAVFPSVPWQRCQFHLQQNAQAYAPRQEMKARIGADIRAIFNTADRTEAERLLKITVARYAQSAPRLAAWMEENLPDGFTVFDVPKAHQRRLRTTNSAERLNREIRRRARVASLFPNEASCLRLVTAIVMEISEEWETSMVYLTMATT